MSRALMGPGDKLFDIPKTHYSSNPNEAVFFYGGTFSSFVGGPWTIESEQPWGYRPTYTATYETLEHFYQACKSPTKTDHEYIRRQRGPWAAKKAAQRAAMNRRGTRLREDWEEVKYGYMLTGHRVKYRTVAAFRADLLFTGDRLIAEDSPTDFEWGIRDAQGGYTGNNLLGKVLMEIRDELREDR